MCFDETRIASGYALTMTPRLGVCSKGHADLYKEHNQLYSRQAPGLALHADKLPCTIHWYRAIRRAAALCNC